MLAFDRAVELYERALEIRDEETLAVYPLLADALVHAGQPARAAEKYLMASSLVDDSELKYQHLTNAAYNFLVSGHFEQGIRLYRPVLKHYRILFPGTQRRALRWYFRCVRALKRSGLQYEERREDTISEHDLARLDVMDLVARGVLVVDNIRGVYFTAIAILTSLRIGEPRRFLRSLDLADSTDTLARAGESVSSFGTRLLDAERVMARARGDHQFLGRSLVNAAQKSLSRGEWRLALEQSSEGLNNLHNVRRGTWEANTGTMLSLRAMDQARRAERVDAPLGIVCRREPIPRRLLRTCDRQAVRCLRASVARRRCDGAGVRRSSRWHVGGPSLSSSTLLYFPDQGALRSLRRRLRRRF